MSFKATIYPTACAAIAKEGEQLYLLSEVAEGIESHAADQLEIGTFIHHGLQGTQGYMAKAENIEELKKELEFEILLLRTCMNLEICFTSDNTRLRKGFLIIINEGLLNEEIYQKISAKITKESSRVTEARLEQVKAKCRKIGAKASKFLAFCEGLT